MMKKSSGPAFVRCLIPMTECPSCNGAGLIRGVFHQLECIGCHSSGFVHAETLEPLLMQDLVIQLGLKLRSVRAVVKSLESGSSHQGEFAQYNQNNRRGAGGTNFTGD
ncbi:hypothetical protein [Pseudomonas fluorescens]|uniref:Prophage PssSM-03 n=2 Tax=Pseudomonas TaxID=286 RepID=A0A2T0HM91_PSEFL|nr:hypothetical protein [Pseudomonas fluorescens]PRW84200.1 hypothetical protein C7A10_29435 [Pseudomonas fluorescens]